MRTVRDASGALSFVKSREDIEREKVNNNIREVAKKYKAVEKRLDSIVDTSKISELEDRVLVLEQLVSELKSQLDGVMNDRQNTNSI